MNISAKAINGGNCVELDRDGVRIACFSYGVLVAVRRGGEVWRTSEHHSVTTSKHANAWLSDAKKTAEELDPADLAEELIGALSD